MFNYEPLRLQMLVEQYMRSRKPETCVISVEAASRALLTVMPGIPTDETKLSDLIAASAVKHGYVVRFDL